jgi:TRAP-type C4-dicarboxylate transport system permease small subunit
MSLGGRWLRWFGANLEELAGGGFFLVMVGSVSVGVLYRYAFRHPLVWTEEVSNFCFLWAAFLGAAATAKHRTYIAVDALVVLFPTPLQRATALLIDLLAAALTGAIAVLGVEYALAQRGVTTEALEMPMVWWASAVPVWGGLACGYAVRDFVRHLRAPALALSPAGEGPLPGLADRGGAVR